MFVSFSQTRKNPFQAELFCFSLKIALEVLSLIYIIKSQKQGIKVIVAHVINFFNVSFKNPLCKKA